MLNASENGTLFKFEPKSVCVVVDAAVAVKLSHVGHAYNIAKVKLRMLSPSSYITQLTLTSRF